jgi:long-chain acyl-CoA synthetase
VKVFGELKPKAVALQNVDYLRKFAAAYPSLPHKPERVLLLRGEVPSDIAIPGLMTVGALRARGREILGKSPAAYEEMTSRLQLSDVATLTSTSGTTGEPKSFVFNHAGQIKAAQALVRAFRTHFQLPENAGILNGAFPSDDIFSFFVILTAAEGDKAFFFCSRDRAEVFASLQIKGPDLWFMTPQVVYDINRGFQHQLNLRLGEGVTSFLYNFASKVGYKYFEKTIVEGSGLGLVDKAFHKLCDKIIYKTLRNFLGGTFYGVVIGSQKLDHRALGIMGGGHAFTIKQNYGTREVGTIGFGINNVYAFDQGVEFKLITEKGEVFRNLEPIAKTGRPQDGVLRVKTLGMAMSYWPPTKPMFDEEGFFDTGDLVRISPDGRMEFLGRQKYWIYDNGAEAKFNPEDVEGLLKVINGVGQAIILSRFEHMGKFVPQNPTTNRSIVGVLASDLPYEKLLPAVVEVNKKVPPLHRLAAFIVVSPIEWEPGKGLVTETMKPRRGPIADFYEKRLDEVYMQIDQSGGKPLIPWE